MKVNLLVAPSSDEQGDPAFSRGQRRPARAGLGGGGPFCAAGAVYRFKTSCTVSDLVGCEISYHAALVILVITPP